MALADLLQWLEAQPFATAISGSPWMFPVIETVHVVAIALVVGSIAMLDLRLLGVARRSEGVIQLAEDVLPWTWASFAVAVVSGCLMFSSNATKYFSIAPFRLKMVLLVLAGINMGVFHLTAYRSVHHWNHQIPTPVRARIAGGLSLFFWICVVICGRRVGFVDL